ncbi:hypothetical protein BDK51DRAFT_29494 [Blyttiomyces helicus]|uniref:SANT and BTB domain-containing protein n=1 Tax=Blyttiomyces helicus TaxID=388810 RepID=A0A4P9WQ66_9FUNG|nr:hypothetical protein BDK51DRAFT_29494 [Blyttiomyces helicus]|eukprot:RKO94303.1 hypothetical protein BDK51DRAFT_29494 [Blyttiomyces helicus]
MRYFSSYLQDHASNSIIDIDVHCDIEVFEWLMSHITRKRPALEPRTAISILISSNFLQMASLENTCLKYIHDMINDVVRGTPGWRGIRLRMVQRKVRAFGLCSKIYARSHEETLYCDAAKAKVGFRGELTLTHQSHSPVDTTTEVYITFRDHMGEVLAGPRPAMRSRCEVDTEQRAAGKDTTEDIVEQREKPFEGTIGTDSDYAHTDGAVFGNWTGTLDGRLAMGSPSRLGKVKVAAIVKKSQHVARSEDAERMMAIAETLRNSRCL